MESVTQDIEQYTIDALYTNSYTNNTVGIQCSNPIRTNVVNLSCFVPL